MKTERYGVNIRDKYTCMVEMLLNNYKAEKIHFIGVLYLEYHSTYSYKCCRVAECLKSVPKKYLKFTQSVIFYKQHVLK